MLRTITTIALLTAATTAFAHPFDEVRGSGDIDMRQHRLQERIAQGVRTGQLTRHEARRLEREQAQIEAKERAYLADGRLSRYERADLMRDLDRASFRIREERHDEQYRW